MKRTMDRAARRFQAMAGVLLWVASAGSGLAQSISPQWLSAPAAAEAQRRWPQAVQVPTTTEFFNWAEVNYPALFPSPRPSNQTFQAYTYRYYAATDLALGVTGATVVGLVNALSGAPTLVPLGQLADYACRIAPATCTTSAAVDTATVAAAASVTGAFVGLCSVATTAMPSHVDVPPSAPGWLAQWLALGAAAQGVPDARKHPQIFALLFGPFPPTGATQPPAIPGTCGGTLAFPGYSNDSGTISTTLSFDEYCTAVPYFGFSLYMHGDIQMGKRTASLSGTLFEQTMNSLEPISYETRDATGKVMTSQRYEFTNAVYTPGIPGGRPTAARPNVVHVDTVRITEKASGASSVLSDLTLTTVDTAAGLTENTFSARWSVPSGGVVEVLTGQPVTTNGQGQIVAGSLVLLGNNGSRAVATLVPGTTPLAMQASLTVNGQPVAGLPACPR